MRKQLAILLLSAFALASILNACTSSSARLTRATADRPPLAGLRRAQGEQDEGRYAEINGAKIWYRVEGKGEPLVLIPGGPGFSHRRLLPYFETLQEKFRLIYFDGLGRGESTRAKDPAAYTVDRDVEDLEGLRKIIGVEKFHVFGHSYGGIVAQAYALKYPSHVIRLVLASTLNSGSMWQEGPIDNVNSEVSLHFPEVWAKIQQLRAQGKLSGDPEYQSVSGGISWPRIGPETPAVLENAALFREIDWNPDVFLALSGKDPDYVVGGDIAKVNFAPRLKEIEARTLLTFGRYDRICFPALAFKFKADMPAAKFLMFEHSGHAPHADENALYLSAVRNFLEGKDD